MTHVLALSLRNSYLNSIRVHSSRSCKAASGAVVGFYNTQPAKFAAQLHLFKFAACELQCAARRGKYRRVLSEQEWEHVEAAKAALPKDPFFQSLTAEQLQKEIPVRVISLRRAVERRQEMVKQLTGAGEHSKANLRHGALYSKTVCLLAEHCIVEARGQAGSLTHDHIHCTNNSLAAAFLSTSWQRCTVAIKVFVNGTPATLLYAGIRNYEIVDAVDGRNESLTEQDVKK